ncbi:MAG: ATP-binding protein [Victivallales bacterium]|nr:ATP-binding protein [Victivallales bacterium]
MEKVATDVYTFSRLREENFTYVDKTEQLWEMASGEGGAQFFIARPRRFGKSLAVSTLKSLFEGRRELFAGLAIEPKWDWSKKWPVLHLDMGSVQGRNVAEFEFLLCEHLKLRARELGVPLADSVSPSVLFINLITALAEKSPDGRTVVLVDEYDKPLLGHLLKEDVLSFRDALKQFYSVIKTFEHRQRFTFITGVSKFSKVSIFSDLNNLKDYTMHPKAATLFGYTHEEILKYFPNRIHALGEANGLSFEQAYHEIIQWYDGYKFHPNAPQMINPVSLGCCFDFNEFSNFWSKTATPTFLVDMLRKHPLDFSTIGVSERQLEAFEPDSPDVTTLLYQTGYLTIAGCENFDGSRFYRLDFPNREVRTSFLEFLVPAYTATDDRRSGAAAFDAAKALYAHDVPAFLKNLRSFFRNIPYDLTDRQNEQMWQTIVYVVLMAIGVKVNAEVKTYDGRIDMTVEAPADNYIVEFKLDRPAAEAMAQIRGKDYAAHFAASRKRLTLIAISFSSEKRTIVEELVEEA